MNCKKRLAWFDNIPVVSWILLRGKCRKCHAGIGFSEILAEVSLGLVFVLFSVYFTAGFLYEGGLFNFFEMLSSSFTFSAQILILFVALVIYWILLVFDAKWGELPVSLMLVEIVLSILYQVVNHGEIFQILMSVGILAGIYYLLYFLSKEKWVGGGDWILCVSIAIFLGRFELAVIELFLANALASVYAVPSAILKKDHHVPFGPFLILSLVAILILKDFILRIFYF